jgi:hypothetical protein
MSGQPDPAFSIFCFLKNKSLQVLLDDTIYKIGNKSQLPTGRGS